jgi:hypothetical protein
MATDGISVPYNRDLQPLEKLLAGVRRPGDFFVCGAVEVPMPRVEIEGVGVLSFPLPEAQIRHVLAQATRAPYGRGEETILDPTVRKTWQLTTDQVRIGGKSWETSFQHILEQVIEGLGCEGMKVAAEFYKLLVYDAGGFFKAHRDTEKAGGMFGTLVVVLPSAHRGGELIIRHAGREVTADLSTPEVSELRFAAFYADCEHEVRPITEGHRVCLIYNLIQQSPGQAAQPLKAPLYDAETGAAAKLLQRAFAATGAPAKLAWLLEHQYSPAGLSLAALKGADAALAKVLRAAAEQAGCAVHLGILHIEETGPAQPDYESGYGYGRRRGWRSDEDEEVEEEVNSESFEVIEVSDASRFIDQWVDSDNRPVAFGRLPLEDGEVLPAGALDDVEPDEQRLLEATGNEGASFERSYHRAALVVWPRDRFADVLLQAGVGAVLPHLKDRVRSCRRAAAPPAEREAVTATALRIIEAWEAHPGYPTYRELGAEPDRADMIQLLAQLGDTGLLERFIQGVVTRLYDGSENAALAGRVGLLGPKKMGEALVRLARENMRNFHQACVNLLHRLTHAENPTPAPEDRDAWRAMAAVIVAELPKLTPSAPADSGDDWWRAKKAKPADAAMVADLLDSLAVLEAPALRAAACDAVTANVALFDPPLLIVPALVTLHERGGGSPSADPEFQRLWRHAADFLLKRSEQPPAAPTDWRQDVKLSCKCEDCRELQVFTLDPVAQVHRFRVRQDRRQHLHQRIEQHGLDMTHVTERKGSPQTLVCTKTRRTYQRQCEQHQADCVSMGKLLDQMGGAPGEPASFAARLTLAKARRPQR